MPAGASILVVDDDESMLEFCTAFLAHEGHEVRATGSGREALLLLQDVPFDIVLTDHVTVDSAGTPIIAAVRAHQPKAEIIVMSGIPTLEDASKSYLAGAREYLSKPFSVDRLRRALDLCRPAP